MDGNLGLTYYISDISSDPLLVWSIYDQGIWSHARTRYRTLSLYCHVGITCLRRICRDPYEAKYMALCRRKTTSVKKVICLS